MSEQKTCFNCKHWSHEREVLDAEGDVEAAIGRCSAMPPQMCYEPNGTEHTRFPRTLDTDVCGQWKPDAPVTLDDAAKALAEAVLLGDLTAARALADRVSELSRGD